MNWITDYVRPTLRALVGAKNEVPDALWSKCPSCEQMLFLKDLNENNHVCGYCDHHLKMTPQERFKSLFDDQHYTVHAAPKGLVDPLKFKDTKRYTDRLKQYRAKTNHDDVISIAQGTVQGNSLVVCAFDFAFMGGSMGTAVGEAFIHAAELALKNNCALLVIPASGGARMQEGMFSLMQMPRTTVAVQLLKEARLPYIVLLSNPTTGGVSASFAMLGDVTLAEPKCTIGFAGRRVIEETIKQKLPDNFQTAEYLHERGMVDRVVHRHKLKSDLGRLLSLLQKRKK